MQGLWFIGFWVWGLRFGVKDLGLRVWGQGLGVYGFRFWVLSFGF